MPENIEEREAPNTAWFGAERASRSPGSEYLLVGVVVLGVTLPALLLSTVIGSRGVALIYLLVVVVMALFVGRGPTLFGATLSALFWDFFFLAPITNLRIARLEDAIQFGMYFVVALVVGELTARLRSQERATRLEEKRATALYLLMRELSEAISLEQLVKQAVGYLRRAFKAEVAVLLPDTSQRLNLQPHPASSYDIAGPEQPAAEWTFENGQWAGSLTAHWPKLDTLFIPLRSGGRTLGVAGLNLDPARGLSRHEQEILEAISKQIALLLDRQGLREESERAKLLAQSERLSNSLLSSISHEIRTPLSAIKGGVSNLMELDWAAWSANGQTILGEIQEASDRLDRLVGKVLDVNRIESGHLKANRTPCDVGDLVQMAAKQTSRELARHRLSITLARGLPLVRMDFVLMQQALANLLSNAAAHTPVGTAVRLSVQVQRGELRVVVADEGPGIEGESLERVFDKFYRGPGAPTGGTGLGLSLVKGFVEVQGGRVRVENGPEGGAVFTIVLPLSDTAQDAALKASE